MDRKSGHLTASTRRSFNVGTMLAHRLRRRTNIVPTSGERLLSDGINCKMTLFKLCSFPRVFFLHLIFAAYVKLEWLVHILILN